MNLQRAEIIDNGVAIYKHVKAPVERYTHLIQLLRKEQLQPVASLGYEALQRQPQRIWVLGDVEVSGKLQAHASSHCHQGPVRSALVIKAEHVVGTPHCQADVGVDRQAEDIAGRREGGVLCTDSAVAAQVHSVDEITSEVKTFAGVATGEVRYGKTCSAPAGVASAEGQVDQAVRVRPAICAELAMPPGVTTHGTSFAKSGSHWHVRLGSSLRTEATVVAMGRADVTSRAVLARVPTHTVPSFGAFFTRHTVGRTLRAVWALVTLWRARQCHRNER